MVGGREPEREAGGWDLDMICAQAARIYRIFGLSVLSELSLPEAIELEACEVVSLGPPDVSIEVGSTPCALPEGREIDTWVVAAPGACLLRFAGIGHFFVEGGRRIVVEKAEDATFDDLSPCM